MRNTKIIFIFILLISFVFICFGSQGEINSEQPISIGEKIYVSQNRVGTGNIVKGIVYIYEGCENNSIKIKIRRDIISVYSITPPTFENLILPLNTKKQALLKVETLLPSELKKEILITIADEFYRIKAEYFKDK